MTQIKTVMTRDVRLARRDETLGDAARTMADADIGSLPVADGEKLVGMVTDRDIVIRGLAAGLGAEATIDKVMTQNIRYCFSDDDVATVAKNMADLGIRRLPVIDRDKKLVGIVSLSNIVSNADSRATEVLLDGVARPH